MLLLFLNKYFIISNSYVFILFNIRSKPFKLAKLIFKVIYSMFRTSHIQYIFYAELFSFGQVSNKIYTYSYFE